MFGDGPTSGALLAPPGPLSPERAEQLRSLVTELTSEQALWLSGYLAAVAERGGGEATPPPTSAGNGLRPLLILFGTETGNAARVAERLVERAGSQGVPARAVDMADFPVRKLRDEPRLLLISSTHGEGTPPESARSFFDFLLGGKAPRMEGVEYAVLALGDSSYLEFCRAGILLDERMEALGATRVVDRVECDVDFDEAAEGWIGRVVEHFALSVPAGGGAAGVAIGGRNPILPPGLAGNGAAAHTGPGTAHPGATAGNPYLAELLEVTPLTGTRSDKETIHVELRVEEGAIPFLPGDSIGVIPENEEVVVNRVLEAIGAEPDTPVTLPGGDLLPVADALRRRVELTLLTPKFLAAYAGVAESTELRALLAEDRRGDLLHFMRCHQLPDVLARFPVPGLEAQQLVEMLRRLQPRLYSIASSPRWHPDQLDLTVAVTRRTPDGKARNGVTSTYLAERRKVGDGIPVYLHRNPNFHLPEDPNAPVILVGAGTGVAPFRAFLQDRAETGATGPVWLFFGERRFREDFLYQIEWQQFLRDGHLTRMDVAFSRDQEKKIYVQHRLEEQGSRVWEWLEEGGHLYVCGDAEGMAPGVRQALLTIIRRGKECGEASAEEYLTQLRSQGRYRQDVY